MSCRYHCSHTYIHTTCTWVWLILTPLTLYKRSFHFLLPANSTLQNNSCSSKHKHHNMGEVSSNTLLYLKTPQSLFTVQYFTNHIHFSYRWFYFSLFFSLCGRKKKRRRMKQIRSLNQEQSKTTDQYLSFWNSTCIARDVSRRSTAPFAISKVLDHYSYLD